MENKGYLSIPRILFESSTFIAMKNMVNTYLFAVYGSYEISFVMKPCSRLQNKH